jgi:uncharacterized protein
MNANELKNILLDQRTELLSISGKQIKRTIEFEKYFNSQEIAVITGVRRCGKSTLLKQIACLKKDQFNIHYINFEDFRLIKFELEDFERAYSNFLVEADSSKKTILLYDEIENVKGWERWVSSFSANLKTKVFVTGSNATLLNSELSTLLTGRHEQIKVTPLSFSELVPNS